MEFWGGQIPFINFNRCSAFSLKDIFKYVIQIYICPMYETNSLSLLIFRGKVGIFGSTKPAHSLGRLVTMEKES